MRLLKKQIFTVKHIKGCKKGEQGATSPFKGEK